MNKRKKGDPQRGLLFCVFYTELRNNRDAGSTGVGNRLVDDGVRNIIGSTVRPTELRSRGQSQRAGGHTVNGLDSILSGSNPCFLGGVGSTVALLDHQQLLAG